MTAAVVIDNSQTSTPSADLDLEQAQAQQEEQQAQEMSSAADQDTSPAKRVNIVAVKTQAQAQEWRSEDTKAIAAANKQLFDTFKTDSKFEDDMNRIAWLDELRRAKAARDTEIAALRADRRADRAVAQDKKAHDVETAGIVRETQRRHRAVIHGITAAKPKPVKFDDWLIAAAKDDAAAAEMLAWRQQKNDRDDDKRASRMFDLRKILDDAGWQPESRKGDTETWTHPTDSTRTIVMKLDQDGEGIRWIDPTKKTGGGFDALLSAIHSDPEQIKALRRNYLAQIPVDLNAENMTARRFNSLDHRTLDVTDARRIWKQSRPVAQQDMDNEIGKGRRISDVINALGDRAGQARLVDRPGGQAVIVGNKDGRGNIVGFELVSADYRTITRGSNVKETFACKAVERRFRQIADEERMYELAKTDVRCLDRLPPETQERMRQAFVRIAKDRDERNPLERKVAVASGYTSPPARTPVSSHGRSR